LVRKVRLIFRYAHGLVYEYLDWNEKCEIQG
jgi:hypothetical protein